MTTAANAHGDSQGNASSPTNESAQELKVKAQQTRDSLTELVELARKAAEEKFNELTNQSGDKAGEMRNYVEEKLREKPTNTLLIASGIGLLLGYLLGRR